MSFHSKMGLVLSGGGMRGLAHIGVIEAMREYDIHADIISGSSMGALVGAMYSANFSTKDMLSFFRSLTLFSFRNYTYKKPGILDSERFRSHLLKLFPSDSFNDLNKTLYISVTNLMSGKNQIIEEGSLITAIMCSAAFPGVFSPVRVGEVLYADGGITNNFPIEPLQSRCECIIGSYVNPLKQIDNKDFKNTFSVIDRALHISMYEMETNSFHYADVFIMPEKLQSIPTFSLKYIDETYMIGYEKAKEIFEKHQFKKN